MDAPSPTSHIYLVWGLKRSGIHYFVNWLYANLGASGEEKIAKDARRHPQMQSGKQDGGCGVAFFNNVGGKNSREFSLGDVRERDFRDAARPFRRVIFGLEDADLARSLGKVPSGADITHIMILRDPLNHLASRIKGSENRPLVFPTDQRFMDLMEAYAAEFMAPRLLPPGSAFVNFNEMVADRGYRDTLAARLGLENVDFTAAVSGYGGGSSFTGTQTLDGDGILRRYQEQDIPAELRERLAASTPLRDVCRTAFGYDLAAHIA